MAVNTDKNILFVIDLDVNINDLLNRDQNKNRENIIVLQSGLVISPFDDLMRSIIIAVYQHNIEEIVVVSSPNKNRQKSFWTRRVAEYQVEYPEKIQTLNYLFKNCKPEFLENDLSEWFEGGETVTNGARNTVSVISQHPLIPSDIKITEISNP